MFNNLRRKQMMLTAFMLMLSSFISISFVCKEKSFKSPIHETRGVWVTRWDYTTKTNSTEPDIQKAEIRRLFKIAKDSNLNSVFFQIRGTFDAYYKSNYEPWAKNLTDTLGVDPGWDPLEFAIRESKKMGLQLHAWVNTTDYNYLLIRKEKSVTGSTCRNSPSHILLFSGYV